MANTDQKTVIKEIKSHIKEINKRTGAKLSYNDIYNKMDIILKMTQICFQSVWKSSQMS